MRRHFTFFFIILFCFINQSYSQTPCVDSIAGIYPCYQVDLLAFLEPEEIGGTASTKGNDIWGWTDPGSGREFALMGLRIGTSFIEVTDPVNPQYLGILPTHKNNSTWRDIKVFKNHAFIGSEDPEHGVQVFDLTELLDVQSPPDTFTETSHIMLTDIGGRSHNIVINEESEFAYAVGTSGLCSGGITYIDISDPKNPVIEGCYSGDGYTHDAVSIIYRGPDSAYIGKEICIASNEDTETILDFSHKNDLDNILISRNPYNNSQYTHQAWVSDDHRYLLFNDELDEINNHHTTRTHIMEIIDLDNPVYLGYFESDEEVIDHNLYIKGQYCYQSNYEGGLRILDLKNLENFPDSALSEIAFFDTYPDTNRTQFNGTWSNYPYFKSGIVVVSNFDGFFVLRPNLPHFVLAVAEKSKFACPGDDIVYFIQIDGYSDFNNNIDLEIDELPAGMTYNFTNTSPLPGQSSTLVLSGTDNLSGKYSFRIQARSTTDDKMHDLALSFEIDPVPDELYIFDEDFDEDGIFRAKNQIKLSLTALHSPADFTLIAPEILFSPSTEIQLGAELQVKNYSSCQN